MLLDGKEQDEEFKSTAYDEILLLLGHTGTEELLLHWSRYTG